MQETFEDRVHKFIAELNTVMIPSARILTEINIFDQEGITEPDQKYIDFLKYLQSLNFVPDKNADQQILIQELIDSYYAIVLADASRFFAKFNKDVLESGALDSLMKKIEKLKSQPKTTKENFRMKEGTEKIWKYINKFINENEWAEGEIFFSTEPVRWIEKGGRYTLVEFVLRITKYDIDNLYNNDLYLSDVSRDDRNKFITTFFTIDGSPITLNDLKEPRKKETRERNKKVRAEFLEYLEKLIAVLDELFGCNYPIQD